MCSNNQSGVSPKIQRNSTPEISPLYYDRDELAREILDICLFNFPRLGDALYNNLGHIKDLCESIQQVCLASSSVDEISINTDDLHGLLAVIVNEIKIANVLANRLSSLEAKYNSEIHKYQQKLEKAQLAATSKNKGGKA